MSHPIPRPTIVSSRQGEFGAPELSPSSASADYEPTTPASGLPAREHGTRPRRIPPYLKEFILTTPLSDTPSPAFDVSSPLAARSSPMGFTPMKATQTPPSLSLVEQATAPSPGTILKDRPEKERGRALEAASAHEEFLETMVERQAEKLRHCIMKLQVELQSLKVKKQTTKAALDLLLVDVTRMLSTGVAAAAQTHFISSIGFVRDQRNELDMIRIEYGYHQQKLELTQRQLAEVLHK